MTQLPAYLQNRQPPATSLAQRGLQNVGTGAGPYLSLNGDRFTLIDAAGSKQPIQTLFFDVCIVDINDHLSKMFYGGKYDPNNTDPPLCWSDNGIGPSSTAREPQSLTCETCPNNVWGSKISEMGSEIKACRDEQKVGILVPGMPNNLFRLTIPPNSLKEWRAYLAKFLNAGFDVNDVVTRLTINPEGKKLQFAPAPSPWLDDATLAARDKALATKATDMIVGRLDRPKQQVLAAQIPPSQSQALEHTQSAMLNPTAQAQPLASTAAPVPVPNAAATATTAQVAAPTRRRRTKAEIEADNAKAAQGQPAAHAMAPFRPAPPPAEAQPNESQPPAFGVGQGVAPDPALQNAINSIFG